MDLRNQRRWQAVLIAAIFAVPIGLAMLLSVSGWVPKGRSYGQAIRPALALERVPLHAVDGKAMTFTTHDAIWTLLALPGPGCAKACLGRLDLVHRAQITLGQKSANLRLLYLGTPPVGPAASGFGQVWTLAQTPSPVLDPLRAREADSVALVLVNPAGKALVRYAPHFDAERLRLDLKKVLH